MKKMKMMLMMSLSTVILLASCSKSDNTHLDLYKNKEIRLLIKTVDLDDNDNLTARVGALAVNEQSSNGTLLTATNIDGTHKYIDVTTALARKGDVSISSVEKAWQFVMTYDFKANATPYTVIITPYFDNVAQPSVTKVVSATNPHKGTLEFKTYQ